MPASLVSVGLSLPARRESLLGLRQASEPDPDTGSAPEGAVSGRGAEALCIYLAQL